MSPRTLDAAEMYALIPHDGSMRLLDAVLSWDAKSILCSATSHTAEANPLREKGVLANVHALEYAAQAIAVHGSLAGGGAGVKRVYVAAFRDVDMAPAALGSTPGSALRIHAEQHAATPGGWSYGFSVTSNGSMVARGKVTVVVEGAAA
jgi:predicted hotdog family 3-hydroxylacyl-ACP dehydratase